jgi:hypothetical protein
VIYVLSRGFVTRTGSVTVTTVANIKMRFESVRELDVRFLLESSISAVRRVGRAPAPESDPPSISHPLLHC